jgi:riboflavin biosynthesis pyrimidine reductase
MDRFLKIKCEDGRVLSLDTKTGQLAHGEMKFSMDLSTEDVHIQQALADAVLGYKLADSIADDAVKTVPVQKQTDKYFIWDK